MEDEIGRILSPFTVVDAVTPISVAKGYTPCRMGSTDFCSRYGVSSETGQCMWKVFLCVKGIGSGYI